MPLVHPPPLRPVASLLIRQSVISCPHTTYRNGCDILPCGNRHTRRLHGTPRFQNHYETLSVSPSATAAEIKRSFYALSKKHHPDRNPDDPTASTRFLAVSEAYHVLSSPDQRAAYDRSIFPASQRPAGHSGSWSSHGSASGSAGGRPATGLSRRRTQFRGPPPSFYAAGGYGSQHEKRSAAAEEASTRAHRSSAATDAGDPNPSHEYDASTAHWDRDAHFRTHEGFRRRFEGRETAAREERRRQAEEERMDMRDGVVRFAMLGAVVGIIVGVVPLLWVRLDPNRKGKKGEG